MGAIVYPLGLVVAPLTGWPVNVTIIVTGALMTAYTMVGGMKAMVWVGVLHSVVLVSGTALCLAAVVRQTPGGFDEILRTGAAADKFSLGSFGPSLAEPTFWVMLLFGLATHLSNFAVDQSYVQRYLVARDDREAAKSVWITALMYVPVAAIFFFIGTSLFVFYGSHPELASAFDNPDKAFPHFISTQLPIGAAGLVVAAIFAASMDSNLTSMATLTLNDVYLRFLRPNAGEREALVAVRLATLLWGAAGTGLALAIPRIGGETGLDAWWQLAGLFSGGVLGLFLLGLVSRADNAAGVIGVIIGVLVITWMTLPALAKPLEWDVPRLLTNPMHANMTIVVGTLTIFLVGLLASRFRFPSLEVRG
jgi:SSS family solute:Na+ symporter